MGAPKTATASWTTQFYLTVNNGGHSTVGGAGWYDSSATAYATITDSIVAGSAGVQYVFKQWTIDATGTKKTSDGIFMGAPKTATASWTTQFYLTVNNGGHSTTGGTGWYDSSATAYATITDSIVAGSAGVQYVFKQWTIDATGTKKTSDGIFMGAPKTATASWTTQFYLTLVTNPPGITTPTGAGWCDKNSNAPISTPSSVNVPPSYSFTKWTTTDMTEIADSLSVSTTVYMDTAKTVTANYAQPEAIRDVGVDSILTPGDTVVTCTPFNPVIRVSNNSSPSMTETCTLRVKIWRFRVKYDSVCHISVNPLDSVVAYDTSLVITINTGLTNITMPPWHPIWADLYWLSSPTYHRITASVHMTYDANPANDKKSKKFIVKARKYDLQLNYMGLLRGKILAPDTITTGVAYNSFSVVSNSPSGPSAPFRSWFKVIRMKTNLTVYSQYLDRTLAPRTYLCIYYSSGWVANDTGLYKAVSYIETRPGLDSVVDNNRIERYYYAAHSSGSGPMGEVSTLPQTFGLMQNSPNPFRSVTTIRWQIPSESRVTISIYDATGRNIKTLANSTFVPGYYNTTWNCTDDRNQKVSAGIYFYEMRANNYIARHKMVITN
jgi:hypothetical protein